MATRTYCDNCGNTVREPNKFCFGPISHFHKKEQQLMQMLKNTQHGNGGAGGGGGGAVACQPPPASPPMNVIDLCDTCQNIWIDRVKKLTGESEIDV